LRPNRGQVQIRRRIEHSSIFGLGGEILEELGTQSFAAGKQEVAS
jgi:hypothetical protein